MNAVFLPPFVKSARRDWVNNWVYKETRTLAVWAMTIWFLALLFLLSETAQGNPRKKPVKTSSRTKQAITRSTHTPSVLPQVSVVCSPQIVPGAPSSAEVFKSEKLTYPGLPPLPVPVARPPFAATSPNDVRFVLESSLNKMLQAGETIDVQLIVGSDGTFSAILSGILQDTERVQILENEAGKLVPQVVSKVVSLLRSATPAPPAPPASPGDKIVTRIWPRMFVSTSVDSTIVGETAPSSTLANDRGQKLIDELNAIHGASADQPFIRQQDGHTLFLRGPLNKIVDIERDLLRLDTTWPQVQLQMWPVQVSGSPEQVMGTMQQTRAKFDTARAGMNLALQSLYALASQDWLLDKTGNLLTNGAGGILYDVNFDPNPERPLSFAEALTFVALHTNRESTITQLQSKVATAINNSPDLLRAIAPSYKFLNSTTKKWEVNSTLLFPTLKAAFANGTRSADRKGIEDFASAALAISETKWTATPVAQREKAIADLRLRAAAVDRLLLAGVNAFNEDTRNLFLKPLLEELSTKGSGLNSGAALLGTTRMVVTSRIQSKLEPVVTSYVNTTRPKPLDLDFVKRTFGMDGASGGSEESGESNISKATEGTEVSAASGQSDSGGTGGAVLRTLFSKLSQAELVLLAAALEGNEPQFTRIAPGVAINIRPAVLPDNGSARLQMDFRFGIDTTVEEQLRGKNTLAPVPAAVVKSHRVRTDATINGFDLFDISSVALETSYPRSRYIPVIGSIPILGELIKKPRKNKIARHESLVMVNAVIIPRALDFARFYGH